VLVTMKVKEHVWNLRSRHACERVIESIRRAYERNGMRIVHYSVQKDHLHLVVEVCDVQGLSRGVQGLSVRIARAINRLMGTKGKVFADRFHSRVLRTPREVRHALEYVLCNARKHGVRDPQFPACEPGRRWLDPCSSALAFGGWTIWIDPELAARAPPPVSRPRTWLLAVGWRRAGGPIDPAHRPGPT
jgi:REP element-mobilizing transposase RayT